MEQWNPDEYKIYVFNSDRRHILVEGPDDVTLFEQIIENFIGTDSVQVDIDSAEHLIDFGSIVGNREKVEIICNLIGSEDFADRFVGFADREFREFDLINIRDLLERHKVEGRLVWSRGHSIENYFFDSDILHNPFRIYSSNDVFKDTFLHFRHHIENAISLACAASLAAIGVIRYQSIQNSANNNILNLNNDDILVDLEEWKRYLIHKHGQESIKVDNFIANFVDYSIKLRNVDFETIRWLCHGHIGLSFLWAVYEKCIQEVCNLRQAKQGRLLNSDDRAKYNACVVSWIHRVEFDADNFPQDVLRLLNLPITAERRVA